MLNQMLLCLQHDRIFPFEMETGATDDAFDKSVLIATDMLMNESDV
jgi:hypothetical protein